VFAHASYVFDIAGVGEIGEERKTKHEYMFHTRGPTTVNDLSAR